MDERARLEAIFRSAVAACHPARVVPPHLPERSAGRTIVLALGKAAVPMARVVEEAWCARVDGLAVTHEEGTSLSSIRVLAAGHPIPDRRSVEAAERMLALARSAVDGDLVLVLLSGGASSLAALPGEGLALEEKRRVTAELLRSGASIAEINCVRRHLSRFKGGRLAEAVPPARLVTLAISDVAGDRLEDIGSGPTAADPTTLEDARSVLARYAIAPPVDGWSETPKRVAGDCRIVARAADALDAAAEEARRLGYEPVLLGEAEGEARAVGAAHAKLALNLLREDRRVALISGGELTVTVRGPGNGGCNHEYALAAAIALRGARGIHLLAADTDGLDGTSGAAGAFVSPDTLRRGADAERALDSNDSATFFGALGDQLVTGATGTNVSDLRLILVDRN
jgi:hydroxypyruvate reductase